MNVVDFEKYVYSEPWFSYGGKQISIQIIASGGHITFDFFDDAGTLLKFRTYEDMFAGTYNGVKISNIIESLDESDISVADIDLTKD